MARPGLEPSGRRPRSRHGRPSGRRVSHQHGSPGKWRDPDSNRGHHDFQSCALPTELSRRRWRDASDSTPTRAGSPRITGNWFPSPGCLVDSAKWGAVWTRALPHSERSPGDALKLACRGTSSCCPTSSSAVCARCPSSIGQVQPGPGPPTPPGTPSASCSADPAGSGRPRVRWRWPASSIDPCSKPMCVSCSRARTHPSSSIAS